MAKKIIAFGDVHFSHHREIAVEILRKTIAYIKPDISISLGDLLDCSQFSSFPPTFGVPENDYENDLKLANELIDYVQAHTAEKTVLIEGNHCLHRETEVLTATGWKKITSVLPGELVAQFDINTGEISFAQPLGYTGRFARELYVFENNFMKQAVTGGHDVIYADRKIKADTLSETGKLDSHLFRYYGTYQIPPAEITDDEIRLLTWIIMDGTVVDYRKYSAGNSKVRVQFKLSKQRKIDRLQRLLKHMGIRYTISQATKSGCNKLQPYHIRIYGDIARELWKDLQFCKQFPASFWKLDCRQTKILLQTIAQTDGSKAYDAYLWSSISTNNLTLISWLCAVHGFAFKYRLIKNPSGFSGSGKPQYICKFYLKDKPSKLYSTTCEIVPYNDYAFCLTMPKGTLITRLDGKTAFTGNCYRIDRWAAQKSEGKGAYNLLAPRIQLMKGRKKCIYIPYSNARGNYPFYRINNRVIAVHGWAYGVNAMKKHLELSQGKSVIFGHSHNLGLLAQQSLFGGDTIRAVNCGCLCNPVPIYGTGRPVTWQNGFVIGYLGKRSDTLFPVDIKNSFAILPDGHEISA